MNLRPATQFEPHRHAFCETAGRSPGHEENMEATRSFLLELVVLCKLSLLDSETEIQSSVEI